MMRRLIVFSAAIAAVFAGSGASAETRCETKTQICNDVRLGPRVCQVTICKDDLGNIVSTDVIVLMQDASPPAPPPKKRPPVANKGNAGIKQ